MDRTSLHIRRHFSLPYFEFVLFAALICQCFVCYDNYLLFFQGEDICEELAGLSADVPIELGRYLSQIYRFGYIHVTEVLTAGMSGIGLGQ